MPLYSVKTHSPQETLALGAALAGAVCRRNPRALLLYGELGAGKSALAGALVRALPGGHAAETSSPSFTICNIYYTAPVVRHFDLYRLAPGLLNDELAESLDDDSALTIVEWPERMAKADEAADGVACRISLCPAPENRPENRLEDRPENSKDDAGSGPSGQNSDPNAVQGGGPATGQEANRTRRFDFTPLGPEGAAFLALFFSHPLQQG